MKNFANKNVLITGASSGIGAACAKQFAALGAQLILCARRINRLEALATEINSYTSTKIHLIQLDVTNNDKVKEAITSLPHTFQAIDILVNNAGLALGRESIAESKVDDWEQMIDTNVKGLLYVTRHIVPGMVQRKSGHIINIGSIAGKQVYSGGGVYCATKHAMRALTDTLRIELLGTGVRVSSVDPGMVETEFSLVRFAGDDRQAKQVYSGLTPLTAEDVADAVVYCASCPVHVTVGEMLLLPTDQASVAHIHRR